MYVSDCSLTKRNWGNVKMVPNEESVEDLNASLKLKFATKLFRKEYFGWSRVVLHIFLGLGLYLFDIITDILVVVRYYEGGQWHHNHTTDRQRHIRFSQLEKGIASQLEQSVLSNQSEVISASAGLANYARGGSLGAIDEIELSRETLFFTFLFFLVVPNIVYNLISLCLYIIGTYRLKSYVKSWLASFSSESGLKDEIDVEDFSVNLFRSPRAKFFYYLCLVLSHLILLAPIFRLSELIYITSKQVLLRSKVKFLCKKCRLSKTVTHRCVRRSHRKRPRSQSSMTFRPSAEDEMDVAVSEFSEEELVLKLAHADALQSWADCKFLQCIESNLESLPQLTIQTYVFITGQLDYDYPWINYLSFAWSVLSFSYSLASFKHMPYDYDAASHRVEEEREPTKFDDEEVVFSPIAQFNGTSFSGHPQHASGTCFHSLSGLQIQALEDSTDLESPGSPHSIQLPELVHVEMNGAPDEVDVTRSDHCKTCCPDKSGKSSADGRSFWKRKLLRVIKTGCCPCLYIAKKSTKFFYTFAMGLIIGPRVLALSTLAKINQPALMLMLTVHSAVVVVANIFANIQLCYKLMQFDVNATYNNDTTAVVIHDPTKVPTGEGVAKALFPQLSVAASEKSIPYIDDEPSSRSVTQENTPRKDDVNVSTTETTRKEDDQHSPIQEKISCGEITTSGVQRFRKNQAGHATLRFDQEDGTLGPVKFLDMPEPRLLSRIKDKHLWHLATFVQFLFNIIISIPFFFYFLHVQEIKRTRYLASGYYILWFAENVVIVVLHVSTYHSNFASIAEWSLKLLLSTGCILLIPLVGFLLLFIYYRKLHPERKRKLLEISKQNFKAKQILMPTNSREATSV